MKATFETLRQLGYELISSEAVAINELIKNAIDADASVMKIVFSKDKVTFTDDGSGIPFDTFREIGEYISKSSKRGDMRQHGDKGLGRLATQCIGNKLKIVTWDKEQAQCQKIDWSQLSKDGDRDIEDFIPHKESIKRKEIPYSYSSGTSVEISDLIEQPWEKEDAEGFVDNHYKKFFNVLEQTKGKFSLQFYYDNHKLDIPSFPEDLIECANASFDMQYFSSDHKIQYKLTTKEGDNIDDKKDIFCADIKKYFSPKKGQSENRRGDILQKDLKCNWKKINDLDLGGLGDFTIRLYWFNRKGMLKNRKKQVNEWNTIGLYRDGIIVYPYGTESSDWLSVDSTGLARGGYKFNKQQLIGAVSISKKNNKELSDTTNRQELKHNKHYQVFIMLCYYFVNLYFFDAVTELNKNKKPKKPKKPLLSKLKGLGAIDCKSDYPVCEILEEVASLDPYEYPITTICSLRTLLEACLKYEFTQPHNADIRELWNRDRRQSKGAKRKHTHPSTIADFKKYLMKKAKNSELRVSLIGISNDNIEFMVNIAHGKQGASVTKCKNILDEITPTIRIIVSGKQSIS